MATSFAALSKQLETTGRLSAHGMRPAILELLAGLHDLGGSAVAWGSVRRAGYAAAGLGLAEFCGSTTTRGRVHALFRLRDAPAIRDLAARCACAKGLLAPGAKLSAHVVPDVLPARAWLPGARRCPRCGCTPDQPCAVTLDDGAGEAQCLAAGVFGLPVCSACPT